MFFDLFQLGRLAEAGLVGVFADTFFAPPGVVGAHDAADVAVRRRVALGVGAGEHPQHTGLQGAHLTGVDKQGLAAAVAAAVLDVAPGLVATYKPQADGNASGQKELRGHGDDTVHQVCLDDGFADLALSGAVAR